jgi:tRNA threonylcarbamoyl adenosine modification protein YeaZ
MSDNFTAQPGQRAFHLLGISCDAKGAEVGLARFEIEADSSAVWRSDLTPSLFVSTRQEGQTSSSDALLGMVEEVLGNVSKSAMPALEGSPQVWLDGIVFNAGPGGFTAVRGACAVAQGLGFGWNKGVAAVSSLEAWAESVAFECAPRLAIGQTAEILVLLDARMGELYVGHFEVEIPTNRGFRLNLIAEAVLAPNLVEYWLANNRAHHALHCFGARPSRETVKLPSLALDGSSSGPRAWYCGDFGASYPGLSGELEALGWATPGFQAIAASHLSIESLLRCAIRRGGQGFLSAGEVGPHYVRNKVALNSVEQQALREQNRADAIQGRSLDSSVRVGRA